MRAGRIAVLSIALLIVAAGAAATLETVVVTHDDGRYKLTARAYMQAPREAIFVILTDYDHMGRLSSTYKEYGFLEPAPDGVPIVFTRMEGCVLFFCRSLRRVERMEARAPGFIRTVGLPEHSDFRYTLSEWWLEPDAGGTQIVYHLEMEPDFWVPPLIGPWILERRLQRGGAAAVDRIERLAQELASGYAHAAP